MSNFLYPVTAFVLMVVFPVTIILHILYSWGRGECFVVALSRWAGGS